MQPPDATTLENLADEILDYAIGTLDVDGLVRSWSRGAERISGFGSAEIIGQSVSKLYLRPDTEAGKWKRDLEHAAREGRVEGEDWWIRKDGSRFWAHVVVRAQRDEAGRLRGFAVVTQDLSEPAALAADNARLVEAARNARSDAQAERDRLRALLNQSPAIINLIRGAELVVEFAHPMTVKALGGRPLEGKPLLEAIPEFRDQPFHQLMLQVLRTGEPVTRSEALVRLDRTGKGVLEDSFWNYIYAPTHGADGQIDGVMTFDVEVTEQVKSRRQLEALLAREKFLHDAGVVLSSSLDYQQTLNSLAHLAVPAIADWCTIDMLVGTDEVQRLAVAHVDPTKMELARELRHKLSSDPRQSTGFFHIVKTGEPEFYPEISDALLLAATLDPEIVNMGRALGLRSSMGLPLIARGRVLGVLTLVIADSGRLFTQSDLAFGQELARQAAQAVDNARLFRDAQEASRLKDEFLSTVSHELRTPLTSILGWAYVLRQARISPEKQKQAVETIERNARAQAQLIEDLLDVSRIVSGKLRLNIRLLKLVDVLDAALESAQPALDARNIQLEQEVDPQAGVVHGDPDRLQQVIWNLLSNAIKFTPRSGRISVRLARSGSHIELEVADTGEGIRPDFLPHVFERFMQADGSSRREHEGLGLGLSISKHLVELHGGTIQAFSAGRGQGSRFLVALPSTINHEDGDRDPRGSSARGARGEPPVLVGARVLVVENQADTSVLVAEIFRRCNAEVISAESADAAESALRQHPFDVVVSDIGMPGRDGYDFIQTVRAWSGPLAAMPAVALTARASPEDRSRALRAGFDAHLAKPLAPGELIDVVSALLRSRRRQKRRRVQ